MYDQSKMGNTTFGVNTKLVPTLWAFLNHLNFKQFTWVLGGMIANRKKVQKIQKANLN